MKVPHRHLQSITPHASKYHTTRFKVPFHPCTTPPSSKYNTTSSNYHTTLFKVPDNPLQSTTSPSSKYHITLFKVPHHPLQSTTPPSSNYHTTLYNMTYRVKCKGNVAQKKCIHKEIQIKNETSLMWCKCYSKWQNYD